MTALATRKRVGRPRSAQCVNGHDTSCPTSRYPSGECRECSRVRGRSFSAWLAERKLAQGCDRCGYKACAAALHFHHRDPATKKFNVGSMNRQSLDTVEQEMAKCDLLCANCHAEIEEEVRRV